MMNDEWLRHGYKQSSKREQHLASGFSALIPRPSSLKDA
jgi:hypothetical protein